MPVATPGPTTSRSAPAQRSANASYSRTSAGTEEQMTMPSSSSKSTNARSVTPSSSEVWERFVATRNCSPSRSPSNRPSTVCVLPTSMARSKGLLEVFDLAAALADALRQRLGREDRLVALAAELLDRHVARGVDLGARDHPRRAILVPDPDVLHLQLEERVARLRDVLEVQLVAEVGRILGEDAVPEEP